MEDDRVVGMKNRNWFVRHPLLTAVIVFVVLAIILFGVYFIIDGRTVAYPMGKIILPDCDKDSYDCSDFETCDEVKEVFDSCESDVHRLDKDGDGVACEAICG